jgi:3-hydroxybutyryl-CoA dehydrogenase
MSRVAVLGAGIMGCGIAQVFAQYGWAATLSDVSRPALDRALEGVRRNLERQVKKGALTPQQRDATLGRIRTAAPTDAAADAELVVEAATEDQVTKFKIFQELDQAAPPDAILASNTSSISITALGDAAGVGERIVGTHYWNPPLLMPLVEVVGAERTPPALVARVADLLRAIGKRPVALEREVPGLLWNRLQLAVLRECLWLVDQGIATPETIDEVMRDGLARRWRLTGPFETVGLGGAGTFDAIAANLFPLLSDATTGTGFAGHVPSDPAVLAALREGRDSALAADLRAGQRAERGGRAAPGPAVG